ncbi:helix-turn-helix domain-containing protein [Clostridium sp.]|uniref:PucR family transcriptional regulator n=1 Tax=Clostridium sp. TaxID=1506 RepID=UPI00283BCD8A|nr:helix-turn-helix domain-containing protein [Clostridium sp.]MDR3598646.1 helix-turn-helix domain-containing protein [Clostridium sp.]
MKGLVKYLQEVYESCEIPFEVYADDEIVFKSHSNALEGELLENRFSIGTKNFKIKIEENFKSSIKLLEFCIKNKYKDDYNKKEKIIMQLLQSLDVSKEKIKEVMPEIKEDTYFITINLKDKVIEALDVLKNIYNSTDVIILNYEDTIVLIGVFEDINEHVSSISETVYVSLYEKCYLSYCRIQDYESIYNLYNENMYKINLAKKYNLSIMIFGSNSLLFEKIMDKLNEEIKEKILSNFDENFSKLDEDMIKTIEVFFKLDLNLSEASKGLYVHRNTLIYRLDKIEKYTGYDIRKFNDAVLFKIAFFIWKQKNAI